MRTLALGVVADDVTGAADVASAIREAGLRTVLRLGEPEGAAWLPDADCCVLGLAIRSVPAAEAAAAARRAGSWLLDRGAHLLYTKYCSTFDSTPAGNIGPVADALASLLVERRRPGSGLWSTTTPATPVAGRTQYQGHLFVGDRLLAETPMRFHPVNPMTDSDLVRVLAAQTERPVQLLALPVVQSGVEAVLRELRIWAGRPPAHLLVDAVTDRDLDVVATALWSLLEVDPTATVVGGGSGLAGALARSRAAATGPSDAALPQVPPGRRLIIAGSCSARTGDQVARFSGPVLRLDPTALAADRDGRLNDLRRRLAAAYAADPNRPVLVATTAKPEEVADVQRRLGSETAARLIDGALGELAKDAVVSGVRRLLVAGGETAGAVTRALGVTTLLVGPPVSPGVPWTVTTGPEPLALLLKSGNFGEPDLFDRAWDTAP